MNYTTRIPLRRPVIRRAASFTHHSSPFLSSPKRSTWVPAEHDTGADAGAAQPSDHAIAATKRRAPHQRTTLEAMSAI